MTAPTYHILGLLFSCLPATALPALPTGSPIPPFVVNVTASGDGDSVRAGIDNGALLIDVASRRGIGKATVTLDSGNCPERIRVQLHTQGLEGFYLTCGDKTVKAAVSSTQAGAVSQSLHSPGMQEQIITADSPYWLSIGISGTAAAAAIPLQNGGFEITIPRDCLCTESRSFRMQWIDFYR